MTFRRSISTALLLVAGGCAVLPAGDFGTCDESDACPTFRDDGGFSSDAGYVTGDTALEAGAIPELRSGLCGTCGASNKPDQASACFPTIDAGDAGLYDASLPPPVTDAGIEACRMILGADQTTSAACVSAGTGGDGASCTAGSDCAPGFECVGTGTCRHYCCDDESCTTMSNGSQYTTYFCDVQAEKAASGAKVPVCRQVVECAPLKDNSCNVGEACTVVEINDGAKLVATCDATGDATIGASCEVSHCIAGSACIGPIGARTCQQLCDGDNPCPVTMSCNMKSQALQSFSVGVCSP